MQKNQNRVEAYIYTFDRGRDAYPNRVIVVIPGVSDPKEAQKFVGKKIHNPVIKTSIKINVTINFFIILNLYVK